MPDETPSSNTTNAPARPSPFEGSTDGANDERGAAREGAALPPPPRPMIAPSSIAGGDEVPSDNAVYAARPKADDPESVIPPAAPIGWIRDVEGDLHDASGVTALKIETDNAGGRARHQVRAYTGNGIVSLSTHFGPDGRGAADTHREAVALAVSEAKGLIEYDYTIGDEPEPQPIEPEPQPIEPEVTEEAEELTKGKRKP